MLVLAQPATSDNSVLPTLGKDACGLDASAIRGTLSEIARRAKNGETKEEF